MDFLAVCSHFFLNMSDSDGGSGVRWPLSSQEWGSATSCCKDATSKGGGDSSTNYTQGAKPKRRCSEGTSVSPWGRSLMWCSRNRLTCIGKITESLLAISLCSDVAIITACMGVKVHKSTCLHKAYNLRNWPWMNELWIIATNIIALIYNTNPTSW